jgi:hypothetical protein
VAGDVSQREVADGFPRLVLDNCRLMGGAGTMRLDRNRRPALFSIAQTKAISKDRVPVGEDVVSTICALIPAAAE